MAHAYKCAIERVLLKNITRHFWIAATLKHLSLMNTTFKVGLELSRGGEIAQWLASLSVKRAVQVRAWCDMFVSER